MLKTTSPSALRDATASHLATIKQRRDRFVTERDRIMSDNSRHDSYIEEHVGIARDAAFREYSAPHNAVRESAELASKLREVWSNKMLVLSEQKFDKGDPIRDATIALRTMQEMSAMPPALLQAVADLARANNDLPRLYHALLAGTKLSREQFAVDLTTIEIPEQTAALAALDQVRAMAGAADYAINETSARPKRGIDKLEMARRMQSAPIGDDA